MSELERHTPAQQRFHRFLEAGDNFQCPKCGTSSEKGMFYIDTTFCPLDNRDPVLCMCEVIHAEDYCVCENCGWDGSARSVYNATKKRKNFVSCPTCKGKGVVKGDHLPPEKMPDSLGTLHAGIPIVGFHVLQRKGRPDVIWAYALNTEGKQMPMKFQVEEGEGPEYVKREFGADDDDAIKVVKG